MKTTAISDTHGKHHQLSLSGGDLLIHAGDISGRGLVAEIADFLNWFSGQDYTYKVFIAGNHDFLFEKDPNMAINLIPDNVIYLNDSICEVEGLKIWGSPFTPYFYNWAFNKLRGKEINQHWELIPDDIDVLITHGPPSDILDQTNRGYHVGCEDLKKRIDIIKPTYHIFGHIHESRGRLVENGVEFINAGVLDEHYVKVNNGTDFVIV
jgi:Icc-related predicted phosphoesterase